MEEEKVKQEEGNTMSPEQKEQWIKFLQERKDNLLKLIQFGKVRRIGRALKRNRITPIGTLKPSRPFNNRANTSDRRGVHSRVFNEYKKKLYEGIKGNAAKQSIQ